MPEAGAFPVERFDAAVAAVEYRWEQIGLRPRRLDRKEIAAYRGRSVELGWRFEAQFSDGIRRLDVIVGRGFPFVPPRIVLVDRPPFLTWPHVEKDGVLCLTPDHATLSVDAPYDGIVSLLDEAFIMIEASIRGELDDDFCTEFLTYWHHAERGKTRTILSLVNPAPPSRIISIWEGTNRTVIAEDDNQLRTWLRNFAPTMPTSDIKLHRGVLTWLDEVPLPSQYPSSAREVYDLVTHAGSAHLLDDVAREARPRTFVVFGVNTDSGPAFATMVVNRPKVVRGRDPLIAGFRPSMVPENVFRARLFGGTPADRNEVDRVDPAWIHGRGHDPRIPKLRSTTVAVLGCGSVGAPVAQALARAGVGNLILVDKETLKGANVGRHPLGVGSIGASKAIALAQQIRSVLPHIRVTCHVSQVQDLLLHTDNPLSKVDLIVSVLGDWPAESLLDEWQAAQKHRIPIVYGWTEPHAAAGHAIVIFATGDRLRSGLDTYGSPHLVAVRWRQQTRLYEPACGAAFDPYGPVELGFVTSMVAQAALDAVLGQVLSGTHRIWLARRPFVESAGGTWSDELRAIAPHALEGATTIEKKWGRDAKDLAA